MKRFWSSVSVEAVEGGHAIALDGRRVKTPARVDIVLPNAPLAEAVADEWRTVGETINPRAMPLSGLANAAIDRVAPDPTAFAANIAKYAEGDLLCYRAEEPRALVARQAEAWDALLGWARRRYDVDFACTDALVHAPQPAETVAKLGHAVAALDPFRLAALSPLTTISGSLVAALATVEQAKPADAVWEAVSLDDRWQLEQWGSDAEAEAALDLRRADFLAAARFAELA